MQGKPDLGLDPRDEGGVEQFEPPKTKPMITARRPDNEQGSNQSRRHASMDCRHPGPQDAPADIRVNLGSGGPCRNDGIGEISAEIEIRMNHVPGMQQSHSRAECDS
jgi:hypothetical protein